MHRSYSKKIELSVVGYGKHFGKTQLCDGKTSGGQGRFVDMIIDSLQVYCGKAIKESAHSVEGLKIATMPTWNHVCSTHVGPHHNFFLKGAF